MTVEKPDLCVGDFLEGKEGFEDAGSDIVGTWRWGTVEAHRLRRVSDNTYWSVDLRFATSGEHGWMYDDPVEVSQVEPVKITAVTWGKVGSQ